jgi:hypothetical protein
MKRSFLAKLQRTAFISLAGAILLLPILPVFQLLVLGPQGYSAALAPQASLVWIQGHSALFLLYRLILVLGFVLLLGLPFALFRIIIAQEIIGRAELEEEEASDGGIEASEDAAEAEEEQTGLPANAWRGKGFAVIAAWTGLLGLLLIVGGILASTIYLWSSAGTVSVHTPLPGNFTSVASLCAILAYTVGGGLQALSCLFFGFVIARSGRRLWPDSWVAFGYVGLAIGAIASGSAVQVALSPTGGQAVLTTPTILLFALWSAWFSIMVVRLQAE